METSVKELHILSLGAGVQSTALYLMFMRGMLNLPPLDYAIFADTQDEPKAVYDHLEWLKSLGGPPILTGTAGRIGDDLKRGSNSTGQRFASIPAFTTNGERVGRTKRQCSREYKIDVIGKVLRRDILGLAPGRTPRGIKVTQYIGISLDEAGRAARLNMVPKPRYLTRKFPLVDNLVTRGELITWLPKFVPHETPRSACVFCPFHDDGEWLRIKNDDPQAWLRAVEIDETLRSGAIMNRKLDQKLYLHRSCKPLVQIDFAKAVADKPALKQTNIQFASECLGVCGV